METLATNALDFKFSKEYLQTDDQIRQDEKPFQSNLEIYQKYVFYSLFNSFLGNFQIQRFALYHQ